MADLDKGIRVWYTHPQTDVRYAAVVDEITCNGMVWVRFMKQTWLVHFSALTPRTRKAKIDG